MTVSTTATTATGEGNDSATTFSFSPLVIYASSDLVVTKVDADGIETLLAEGTGAPNYRVSVGTYPNTGSVIYPAVGSTRLATGESIIMKRVLPLLQETNLGIQGPYDPEVQETQFDKLVYIDQQQQEEIDRSVKVALGSDVDPDDLIATLTADAVAAAAAAASAAISATTLTGTSSTSRTIASGSKNFTTQAGKQFDAGVFLIITSDAGPTNYMYGQVTSYSDTALTVNVLDTGGSGTYADWTIRVSGVQGVTGATGAPGAGTGDVVGPSGGVSNSEVAYYNSTTGKIIKASGIVGVASQAEAEAGTVSTRLMTPQRVAQAVAALSSLWVAGTAITMDPYVASTQASAAHGLGAHPTLTRAYLECTATDNGYSVGDRIPIEGMSVSDSNNSRAFCVTTSTSTMYLTTSNGTLHMVNKSSGTIGAMAATKWKLIVTPYLLTL